MDGLASRVARVCVFFLVCFSLLSCQCSRKDRVGEERSEERNLDPKPQHERLKESNIETEFIKKDLPVEAQERQEINRVFERFRIAIKSYDAATALSLLSESSFRYYREMLDFALLSLEKPLEAKKLSAKLSPGIRLNVAMILKRLTVEELRNFNEKSLIKYAIEKGWLGYRSIGTAQLGAFQAFEKDGKNYVLVEFLPVRMEKEHQISKIGFEEVVESSQKSWKIDLVPIFMGVDNAIANYAKVKEIDVSAFLMGAIDDVESQSSPDDWQLYSSPEAGFSLAFPSKVQVTDGAVAKIFQASSQRYGVFSISAYPINKQLLAEEYFRTRVAEYLEKNKVKEDLVFEAEIPGLKLRRLHFHDAATRGLALFVLTKAGAVFELSYLSSQALYNEEVGLSFFDSFAPLQELLE